MLLYQHTKVNFSHRYSTFW